MSGKMLPRICENKSCRKAFTARAADVKRGWGRFCCKSCKAAEQEARTGQHARHKRGLVVFVEFGSPNLEDFEENS